MALSAISYVLGAIIFGSTARGDSDSNSDLDVFILSEDIPFAEILKMKREVADALGCHPSGISVYRLGTALAMAQDGSAFVWHLKLEGEVLYSRDGAIEELLERITPYRDYQRDFLFYRSLLADIEDSLTRYAQPNAFDLSLLFSVCRNTCMRLTFYAGEPKFGRKSAFELAFERFKTPFPVTEETYETLLGWKLWYERGVGHPRKDISLQDLSNMVEQAHRLVDLGLARCK